MSNKNWGKHCTQNPWSWLKTVVGGILQVIFDFRFLTLLAIGGSLAGSLLCFLKVCAHNNSAWYCETCCVILDGILLFGAWPIFWCVIPSLGDCIIFVFTAFLTSGACEVGLWICVRVFQCEAIHHGKGALQTCWGCRWVFDDCPFPKLEAPTVLLHVLLMIN
jgi:hypothetical protein